MGALPKRKSSKTRSLKRRSRDNITPPQLSLEKLGQTATLPHRVSPKSGIYKGKKIIKIK